MKYFILALLIAIIGFANTFFILGRNSKGGNFSGDNIWQAFIFSYRMGLGDFNTDGFGTQDEEIVWILWFLNTITILIILLNLVIAIMGDTFGRVQETQRGTMLQEFSSIMRENEFLFNRKSIFKGIKYIVVIEPEKADGETGSDWEGRLNQLKKFLEESSGKLLLHMDVMATKQKKMVTKVLDEKLKIAEDKTKHEISEIELRIQKVIDKFSSFDIKKLTAKVQK